MKAQTRKEILAAAEQVFSETDLADARVEDILQQAGVSRRTFYQHFSGKPEVAAALMEEAMGGLLQSAGGLANKNVAVADKIQSTVDLYLSLWRRHGRVMHSINREAQRAGSSLHAPRERVLEAVTEFIRTSLAGEGIRVSRERTLFAVLGTEAILMRAAQEDRLGSRRLRGEIIAAVQQLLLPTVNGQAAGSHD